MAEEKDNETPNPKTEELSEGDLKQVSGGTGTINEVKLEFKY